jgi:hypothetical protein
VFQEFEAGDLGAGDGVLCFLGPVLWIDKFFLVLFEEAKASHHHDIDDEESSKLLYLVNQEGEEEGQEHDGVVSGAEQMHIDIDHQQSECAEHGNHEELK